MKKLNGLDKYVIFSLAVVLLYTIAEFITSTITGIEKSTLSTCVYSFWAGEVVSAMLIKIFKIRGNDNGAEDNRDSVDDLLCDGIGDTDSDNGLEQEG